MTNHETNLELTAQQPRWQPSDSQRQHSNAAKLCQKLGLKVDFAALHQWSIENREEYWKTASAELGLKFARPPTRFVSWDDESARAEYLAGSELNIFESCFGAPSDAVAIIEGSPGSERHITYRDLRRLCDEAAAGLRARGIGAGDGVAIDMPMSAEAVIAYLATIALGARVISIADSFAPDEIATRLRLGDAKIVVTQDVLIRGEKPLPMLAKVQSATVLPCVVVETAGGETSAPALRSQDIRWADLLKLDGGAKVSVVTGPASQTINVLFSSGTTGDPKAIPWSHSTPLKCAADARYHHDVREGDIVCWPTNLGWMMGPWLVFAALLNRATIALYTGAPGEREFAKFVDRAGVTLLGVVPSLVKAWRSSEIFEGTELKKLRAFSSTGECSNPGDMNWLMDLAGGRAPVIEYCGGTEIGGGYVTSSMLQPNIASTFSTPALGLSFEILNENHEPTDDGEVWITPPSIGLSTELLNRDHFENYFEGAPRDRAGRRLRRHGDQVVRLPNGYYQALGRVDDTMNLGGIKTSSAEIERTIVSSALVSECAAIAVPPPGGGPSLLVLYCVLEANAAADDHLSAALQSVVREKLNPLFKIQDVKVVDKLPRTASNKVMRRVLRDEYLKLRDLGRA